MCECVQYKFLLLSTHHKESNLFTLKRNLSLAHFEGRAAAPPLGAEESLDKLLRGPMKHTAVDFHMCLR